MADCSNAFGLSIASFVIVVLGVVIHVTGIAAPFWIDNSSEHSGLYERCVESFGGNTDCKLRLTVSDSLQAVRGLETTALIFSVAVAIVLFVRFFLSNKTVREVLRIVVIATVFTAALFVFIGVGVWAADNGNEDLSWAFALTIVGGFFYVVAGILVSVDCRDGGCSCPQGP